ncbi:ABC transporter permease [Candidatus Saccharibacteria bacterium]|nr:ABC transporter permease [Candidatus Saccharibacteria bacterium]
MKTTDIVARAGRNLRRAKMRTILTRVAIAVGGFAIMASLMVGEGARQYVDRIINSNIDPNGLIISKDKRVTTAGSAVGGRSELTEYNPNAASYYGQEYDTLTQSDIEKLRQRKDLKNVEPNYQLRPKYVAFSVKNDKKYVAQVMMRDNTLQLESAAGREIKSGTKLAPGEAIIPESYTEKLGKTASEMVGSMLTITVNQQPQQTDTETIQKVYIEKGEEGVKELLGGKTLNKQFKIVAVVKKSPDQMASRPNLYIDSSDAKELTDFSTAGTDAYQKYIFANATATGGKTPEEVRDSLKDAGYSSMTSKDVQSMIFTFVNILQTIVMGFGILALVVSVFGIINTMYISVLERTQQIGLMKALGASKRDIGRLFRYEAAWVGFLGGMIGVLGAWGIGTLATPAISKALGLGKHDLLIFQPLDAVVVVLSLMLVAIVAGWLPSRKAAKLDPIEALRTE